MFNRSSTALQVLSGRDLSGQKIFITGGTNGIGFETARSLALHGAEVVISGSSERTCKLAQARIIQDNPKAKVSLLPIELTSLSSVRKGAAQLKQRYPKLDVIILNAGLVGVRGLRTEDGLTAVYQVNYLSQFYLSLLIESTLQKGSRLVIVSSERHRCSSITKHNLKLEMLNPMSRCRYWDNIAYNNSKLCAVLHAREMNRRLAGRQVDVMALHPGNMIYTALPRHSCYYQFLFCMARPFTKSLQQGAATTVFCATAPELTGCTGFYFEDCCISKASDAGQDAALACALWNMSVDLLREMGFEVPSDLIKTVL